MRRALALLLLLWLTGAARAAPLQVGFKRDTEGTILGELVAALLRDRGIDAVYRRDLSGGTQVLWRALQQGEVDVYPEYTGTLSHDLLRDERLTQVSALRERLAPLGLGLGEPLGFNNSYGVGVREELAQALGLTRLSDLRAHGALRLGFSYDFLDRAEGWGSLSRRYGLPQQPLGGFEHELAYRAIADGKVDVVDVYTTDAEIALHRLRVLEDDQRHFPLYEPVMLYRIGAAAPGVAGVVRGAPLPAAARAVLRGLEGRIKWLCRRSQRARLNWQRFQGSTQDVSSAAPQDPRDHLGHLTARPLDGRAEWWKSPCSDLARAGGGQPPPATLQSFIAAATAIRNTSFIFEDLSQGASSRHPILGGVQVALRLRQAGRWSLEAQLPSHLRVVPSDELLQSLEGLCGAAAISLR